MSWALEAAIKAIEREALERARVALISDPSTVTLCGFRAGQIQAFEAAYQKIVGESPRGLSAGEIAKRLIRAAGKTP